MIRNEFEMHFRRLYVPLGMYALRLTGDADEAEDVVQETFVNVWVLLGTGVSIDRFKDYMYKAVRNEALRRMRTRSDATVDVDACGDVADETIDTSERDAALWLAIDRLPRRCRDVFLMSKRDGMSNADIADELGISVKTVENQMTKAYRSLRQCLSRRSSKVFFLPFL